MKFDLSNTNKRDYALGYCFLKQMLDKIGFREIEKCESLPVSLSIILIKKVLLESFITVFGVQCKSFLHTEITRAR